jgi:hypothetical protein
MTARVVPDTSRANSPQITLSDHFFHDAVGDCVVVAYGSLRFLTLRPDHITEIARHDHSALIIAASLSHNGDHPDAYFLSGHSFYFAVPSMYEFVIG